MTPGLLRLTAKQVEKTLLEDGFVFVSQQGSHKKWRHIEKNLTVIVPFHRGKTLPLGTLHSIIKASDIPQKNWVP